MAKLKNNELNKEIEYMSGALSDFDRRIKLPDSLRGSELKRLLDDIPEPAAPRFFNSSSLFSLRPVASYAVMFALAVAVYLGVNSRIDNSMVDGRFTVYEAADTASSAAQLTGAADYVSPAPSTADLKDDQSESPQIAAFSLIEPAAEQNPSPEPSQSSIAPLQGRMAVPENIATGGGGQSFLIGESAGYKFTWRQNDPTDPDKVGKPITLEVTGAEASPVCLIDIEEMDEIGDVFFEEDVLVLAGKFEGMCVVNSYAGLAALNPAFTGSLSQPGERLASRLYQGVVYTVSCSRDEAQIPGGIELLPLEGSLDGGICYISAMDVESGQAGILAIENSGDDITLFDRHAYITFNGAASEGDGIESYVAQITFNSTEITLTSIH